MNHKQESLPNLYHLAEIKKIFSCKFLDDLNDIIEGKIKSLNLQSSVEDTYYGYLLNNNSKRYGLKANAKFAEDLTKYSE